jgi:hypothetical protein
MATARRAARRGPVAARVEAAPDVPGWAGCVCAPVGCPVALARRARIIGLTWTAWVFLASVLGDRLGIVTDIVTESKPAFCRGTGQAAGHHCRMGTTDPRGDPAGQYAGGEETSRRREGQLVIVEVDIQDPPRRLGVLRRCGWLGRGVPGLAEI